MMTATRSRLTACCFMAYLLLHCSQQSWAQSERPVEISHDGLSSIQLNDVDAAWARTDIDLHRYNKIILEEAGIQYRLAGNTAGTQQERKVADELILSKEQKQQLKAVVSNAFNQELQRSKKFTLVSEPGPNTLLIRGGLLDVVAKKPAATRDSGTLVYVSEIGEASLVLEIFDSQSGTILARAIDHGVAGRPNAVSLGNTLTTWIEVEKVAKQWARTLRTHLETFCAMQ